MTRLSARRTPRLPARQRGVALITVLLIFALAATLAAAMLERAHLNQRAVANLVGSRQAWHYALGGEAYARQLLAIDAIRGEKGLDTLGDAWANTGGSLEIATEDFQPESGELIVTVRDLQGLFNLNGVVDEEGRPAPAQAAALRRLLSGVGAPVGLAAQWQDWVDRDQVPAQGGAEDGDYDELRTHGDVEADISALRLLRDMGADDYDRIAPHVAALPSGTRVNVNTAGAEVLQSLSSIIDSGVAARIAARQARGGFRTVADFLTLVGSGDSELADRIAVGSDHFEVVVSARHDSYWVSLRSHLLRDRSSGAITVVSRYRVPVGEALPRSPGSGVAGNGYGNATRSVAARNQMR